MVGFAWDEIQSVQISGLPDKAVLSHPTGPDGLPEAVWYDLTRKIVRTLSGSVTESDSSALRKDVPRSALGYEFFLRANQQAHEPGGWLLARDLYRRWLAWGVLTSHTRAHGAPPREPWEYDEALTEDFRRALGLKYSLMPYIYAQAKDSSTRGFPMLRALFFEYPNDPGCWNIDDEYMFGANLLVAPLFEAADGRKVYLPPGAWIDYQSGKVYQGTQWHVIKAGAIPVVLLVRDHSVLPHIKLAQSTKDMDWNNVELRVFSTDNATVSGLFALPEGDLLTINLRPSAGDFALVNDPLRGKVKWQITRLDRH